MMIVVEHGLHGCLVSCGDLGSMCGRAATEDRFSDKRCMIMIVVMIVMIDFVVAAAAADDDDVDDDIICGYDIRSIIIIVNTINASV